MCNGCLYLINYGQIDKDDTLIFVYTLYYIMDVSFQHQMNKTGMENSKWVYGKYSTYYTTICVVASNWKLAQHQITHSCVLTRIYKR